MRHVRAVVSGFRFVRRCRAGTGGLSIPWHALPDPAGSRARLPAGQAVRVLRARGRLLTGFLDPVRDALFLCAGLRALGFPATFHIGRETVGAETSAGYFPWVRVGSDVVSTSLPVDEQYLEVLSKP